jgi:hypothetical protein
MMRHAEQQGLIPGVNQKKTITKTDVVVNACSFHLFTVSGWAGPDASFFALVNRFRLTSLVIFLLS